MIFLTVIAFLVIFSVLVLIHEWGHFFVARREGIKIEEFGIGLPPRARKLFKDKQGTLYSLNWIPFGGFVRLYGEDSADPKVLKDKKSFASKSMGQRTAVILAGVAMNFILAWFLITIGFIAGMKPFLVTEEDLAQGIEAGIVETENVLLVHEVSADSPLSAFEVKSGDYVIKVNGNPVPPAADLGSLIQAGQPANLTFLRGEEEREIEVQPNEEGKLDFVISDQLLIQDIKKVRYPILLAPFYALRETGRLSVLTVKMLGEVITSLVSKFAVPEGVAGPVGIARMTHHFVQQGFMALVQFTALISVSLAVINVMPFPALDGGRFLFIIYELVARRRANARWEAIIHSIGFSLLMLLILIITWHDIANLF